ARKPAPVQVAHFLGHGYTSGLTAMDAFLADDALAPPGSEHLFSEHVVRLPRIPVAYAPPPHMPDVAPLPALKNGYITFGNFGRGRLSAASAPRSWVPSGLDRGSRAIATSMSISQSVAPATSNLSPRCAPTCARAWQLPRCSTRVVSPSSSSASTRACGTSFA